MSAASPATGASRSPLRAHVNPSSGAGLHGSGSTGSLTAAFGLRSNSRTYSRSPPPPKPASAVASPSGSRRGLLGSSQLASAAAHSAHVASFADAALAAREARHPTPPGGRQATPPRISTSTSRSPHVFPRSGSARSLPRPPVEDSSDLLGLSAEALRAIIGKERRQREVVELEALDVQKRLKFAEDEVRLWRDRCEELEAGATGVTDSRAGKPRLEPLQGVQAFNVSGNSFEGQPYDAELSAIEGTLDKIYTQRATLSGNLENMRQQMLMTLEVGGAGQVQGTLV